MGGRVRCTGYANCFRDYKRLGPIAKLATSYNPTSYTDISEKINGFRVDVKAVKAKLVKS